MTFSTIFNWNRDILEVGREFYSKRDPIPRQHLVLHLLIWNVLVVQHIILVQKFVCSIIVLVHLLLLHFLQIHVIEPCKSFQVDVWGQCVSNDWAKIVRVNIQVDVVDSEWQRRKAFLWETPDPFNFKPFMLQRRINYSFWFTILINFQPWVKFGGLIFACHDWIRWFSSFFNFWYLDKIIVIF